MKILYVAMPFSIHTARWLSQLSGSNWDIHLFPSMPFQPLHRNISNVTYHENFYNNIYPEVKGNVYSSPVLPALSFLKSPLAKKAFRYFASISNIEKGAAEKLAQVIMKVKPDIIHSLETQHAGYLVKESKKLMAGPFPTWIHSNWGIDLHFFGQLQEHIEPIRETLAGIDILLVEGKRDEHLARRFGFDKKIYTFPSVGGGFLIPSAPLVPVAKRNKILIKGMQDLVRRGLVGIRALERCIDLLDNYEILLYSADEVTRAAAESFYQRTGKKITVCGSLSQEDMLNLNAQARINLCVNASDGLPNAMLEAMLMGAFPVQSNTSLADEWIINGKNGFLVPPEDPDVIEVALRIILNDDDLCNEAAIYNRALISERLEYSSIKSSVIKMYEQIISQ